MQASTMAQQENMLEKSTAYQMEWMLCHTMSQTNTQIWQILCISEIERRIFVYVCQHASVILRQSSVHIKRNTSPPVTTQCYQPLSVCERNRDRGWEGGGGVCLCQEYECLSASYAKLLSVFMCVERRGVRVLTHCPGCDTAKTAVFVIRQLFTETKE